MVCGFGCCLCWSLVVLWCLLVLSCACYYERCSWCVNSVVVYVLTHFTLSFLCSGWLC